jgi:hypothetical protein
LPGFFFGSMLRLIWPRETISSRSNFYLVLFCRRQDVFAPKPCAPVAILMSVTVFEKAIALKRCARGLPYSAEQKYIRVLSHL